MARLNPNSPIKPAVFRPQAKPRITQTVVREVSQSASSSASEAEDEAQQQWTVTTLKGQTKGDSVKTTTTIIEKPPQQLQQQKQQQRVRHQRTGTVSSGIFDIFSDSDGGFSETEYSSARSSTRSLCETRTTDPLRLSQINSLSAAPLSQPPPSPRRSRSTRKPETYNYDKENDPIEHEHGQDRDVPPLSRNPSDASSSSSRSPMRRPADTRPTPGRGMSNTRRLLTGYRRPEPESADEKEESEEDNDADSMADFIVSDNEDPSYHNTSEDETEEEEFEKPAQPSPSPPRTTTRKRLFRGRRPGCEEREIKKDLQEDPAAAASDNEVDLKLAPSLPARLTMAAPKLEATPRRLFQEEINLADKLNNLHLENNDPAFQLQQDPFTSGQYDDSPTKRSQANRSIESATGTTTTTKTSTPPSSPSKGRLRSPTKDRLRVHIPPTPHRESADAFWSEEVTNDWVTQHSPCKVDDLLREFDEESDVEVIDVDIMPRGANRGSQPPASPTCKPLSKTALKRAETEKKKAEKAHKQAFDASKAGFAEIFFKTLDDAVNDGQVQKLAATTGGVEIVWSKTLQTTAGRATWKRVTPGKQQQQQRESDLSGSDKDTPTKAAKHYVKIELADRIIDSEERIIKTVAHEYCHLANYMISDVHDNPHGESFKAWGRKCIEALQDHPVYGGGRIEISTKHNYKIDYKYVWSCVDCGQTYGRHSKSINPVRSRCGRCHGLLQQIKPKPRSVSPRKKQPLSLLPNARGLLAEVAKVMDGVAAVTTLDDSD